MSGLARGRRWVTVTIAAVALLMAAPAGAQARNAERVCRLDAPELIESSGLVARPDAWVTTNDSGDSGRLFLIDPATCEQVREVGWADEPEDVEALAPGPPGQVWVGDTGDNGADRDSIRLSLVALDDGHVVAARELRYPGGPRDAEAIAVHPATGQLIVVSKSVFGGTVYAAPEDGDQLVELGSVTGLVTDAAFWGSDRLVVRTYSEAVAYSWPALEEVGRIDLPEQEQGEGMAVTGDDLLLTSEGIDQPVWRVPIPATWRAPAATTSPSPAASSAAGQEPTVDESLAQERERRGRRMLVTGVIGVVGLLLLLRSLRPR